MKKSNYFSVGITILFSIIFLGYIIIRLGEWKLDKGFQFYSIFDFANGIIKDGPVMVSGVKLGRVNKIEFVNTENKTRVRLHIILEQKVKIKKNARIYINQAGFMGEKYIEIDPGTPDAPDIIENEILNGQEPIKVEEIISNVGDVIKGVKNTIDGINGIIVEKKVREQISGAISDLGKSLKNVSTIIESNKSKINVGVSSFGESLDNIKKSSVNLNKILEDSKNNISGLLENVNNFSKDLKETIESLKKTAKSFEKSAVTAEPEIIKITKNLSSVSDTLKNFADSKKKEIESSIENINGTLKTLNSILKKNEENISKAIQSISSVSAKLDKTIELVNYNLNSVKEEKGILGVLVNNKESAENFKKIVNDASDLFNYLKHRPGIILNKTKYVSDADYEELNKQIEEEEAAEKKKQAKNKNKNKNKTKN